MTFNPQALYDAVRPFANQLDQEAELLRREPAADRAEQDLIHATYTAIYHTADLGFLLARIRREQNRDA